MLKIFQNRGFAHQLIIYLSFVLAITFGAMFVMVFSASQKFINKNAYYQADAIAQNTLLTFDRKISEIEKIPQTSVSLADCPIPGKIKELPVKILKSYPLLIGCTLYPGKEQSEISKPIYAYKYGKDSILTAVYHNVNTNPDSVPIFKINKRKGYWFYSGHDTCRIVSYCEPVYNKEHYQLGILKLDFTLKTITDVMCDIKLFNSGYLFIMDKEGYIVAHPQSDAYVGRNIHTYISQKYLNYGDLLIPFLSGKTGSGEIFKNHVKHYMYFTAIPGMDWRLAIICPYNEILIYTHQFALFMVISVSIILIILLSSLIHIVRKFSKPLQELSVAVREIADGKLDTPFPPSDSSKEINELHNSFLYMQQNIINYVEQLKKTTAENERISTEMRLAQKIQKRFLPKKILLPDNIELFADLQQSREVGGDLYDHFIIDNHLYFVVGDVSGKSTPAALYMASIVKLVRYVASRMTSTAEICNIINTYMCDNANDDMYITLFIGILDLNTGVVTFTNAGHPYPLIIHQDKQTSFLDKYPDVPIGILEDHEYNEYQYQVCDRDTLMVYTDGITDTENIHAQFYGMERVIKCVTGASPQNPETMGTDLLKDIREHIKGVRQSDDLTILALLFKKSVEK